VNSVGIVGGGLFGCITAIELANNGFDVQIYEKAAEIFNGATNNTQNRLHLGLHYPRDHETAVQSRLGFQDFIKRFPTTVRLDFPNYYGVAKLNSKVSTQNFENFAKKAGIEIFKVGLEDALLPPYDKSRIDSIWQCNEGVIDIGLLKLEILHELKVSGVEVIFNTEISTIEKEDGIFELTTSEGEKYRKNFLVRATYGLDRIESTSLKIRRDEYEFHRTLILEANLASPPFGFTVIDGDFFTILPKGFSGKFLFYGPSICVLEKSIGYIAPEEWSKIDYSDEFMTAENDLISRIQDWMPNLQIESSNKWNTTIRTILPNVSATDKRVSRLLVQDERYVDLWSGKMDHSVEIARQTLNYFKSQR
jgi:glycine/D-amino acid oxidase-like deaminating enzyme